MRSARSDRNSAASLISRFVETQHAWAERNGFSVDRSSARLTNPADATQQGALREETIAELRAGAGGEMHRLPSLRSSASLAVNVFGPWRDDPRAVARAVGWETEGNLTLAFEQRKPTGLSGTPPHLDILLTSDERALGIESKFLEMYARPNNRFSDSYFESPGLWDGLEGLEAVARHVAANPSVYQWLGAGQLIKHALGLARCHGPDVALRLVWFRLDHPVSERLDAEIGEFTRRLGRVIDFEAITYQSLTATLLDNPQPVAGYAEYLRERYGIPSPRPDPALLELSRRAGLGHRGQLGDTIARIDAAEVIDAYYRTLTLAPARHHRGFTYLVDHDGVGANTSPQAERVLAKAIFNASRPVSLGGDSIALVEYEVPMAERRDKASIGEVDLLGLGRDDRLWIFEMKAGSSGETPLMAWLQALRYSAILERNRNALDREILARRARHAEWPPTIAVIAPTEYWDRLDRSSRAGDWRRPLSELTAHIAETLGLRSAFIDCGEPEARLEGGRPVLARRLDAREVL